MPRIRKKTKVPGSFSGKLKKDVFNELKRYKSSSMDITKSNLFSLIREMEKNPDLFKGFTDKEKWDLITCVIDYENLDLLNIFLKNGLDPNFQYPKDQKPEWMHGMTILMYASANNHPETAKLLLEKGADINAQNNDGWTALMYALIYNYPEIAELLLKKGADPNIQNKGGETALMYASVFNHPKIAKLLLENKADPYLRNKYGKTVYDSLAITDEIKKLILSKHNQNLENIKQNPNLFKQISDKDKWLFASFLIDQKDKEIFVFLLKNGLGPNLQYPEDQEPKEVQGMSLLLYALRKRYVEIAKLLIKKGADPNIQDKDGETALMYASRYNQPKIAKLLFDKGADPNIKNSKGFTALTLAMKNQIIKTLLVLINNSKTDIDIRYPKDQEPKEIQGMTLLMFASANNYPEMAELLIDKGVNLNLKGKDGKTALMYASANNHPEIAKLLLEKGADPNLQNENNWTALMYASSFNHPETAELLLEKGADPYLRDKDGETAYDLAKSDEIRALLNKYKNNY